MGAVGAVVTGVSAWIVARITVKPQLVASDAQVQAAINEGFKALTAQYEARNADLVAELRELTQHIESLEAALRRAGLDIPVRLKVVRNA